MADETTTPADLAAQVTGKEQHHTPNTEGEHEAPANDEVVDVDALRAELNRYKTENRKLKDENGERRVKAKQAEEQAATLKKLSQVLGFEPSDSDPEEQLKQAQQVAQEREQERDQLQAELPQENR